MTLMAVAMSSDEWRQLLSSDLDNKTLRDIACAVGDKALTTMLSIENEYINETVVLRKPRATKTVNALGDRWIAAMKVVSNKPHAKTDDEMKQWLCAKLGERSGAVQMSLVGFLQPSGSSS